MRTHFTPPCITFSFLLKSDRLGKKEIAIRKRRWGTCNIEERRIWLNLESAKKPPACLEFILVHEMVHFLERHHNDRFREYMDQIIPRWRMQQDKLRRAQLAYEDWQY